MLMDKSDQENLPLETSVSSWEVKLTGTPVMITGGLWKECAANQGEDITGSSWHRDKTDIIKKAMATRWPAPQAGVGQGWVEASWTKREDKQNPEVKRGCKSIGDTVNGIGRRRGGAQTWCRALERALSLYYERSVLSIRTQPLFYLSGAAWPQCEWKEGARTRDMVPVRETKELKQNGTGMLLAWIWGRVGVLEKTWPES